MDDLVPWPELVDRLAGRIEKLKSLGAGTPLVLADGRVALAHLRLTARPLLEEVVKRYGAACHRGFPVLEDNGIEGAGGSIGVRFSRWHALYFSLENATRRTSSSGKVAISLESGDPTRKRLPGEPMPPPDPNRKVTLAALALRWDDDRGWMEMRRPLPPRPTERELREQLLICLTGLNYDLAAGRLGPRE